MEQAHADFHRITTHFERSESLHFVFEFGAVHFDERDLFSADTIFFQTPKKNKTCGIKSAYTTCILFLHTI